ALVATADGATIVTGTAAAQLGGLGAHGDGRVIELVVGTGSAPLGGLAATAFQDMTGIRPYAGEPIVSGLRAGTPVVTAPVAGQAEPAWLRLRGVDHARSWRRWGRVRQPHTQRSGVVDRPKVLGLHLVDR